MIDWRNSLRQSIVRKILPRKLKIGQYDPPPQRNRGWKQVLRKERMSDCCLTPFKNFSAIPRREQVTFQWDDDDVCLRLK